MEKASELIKDIRNPNLENNISLFKSCRPWQSSDDVGFNWLNYDFPHLHSHNHYEFLIITSGELLHTINNSSYVMTTGMACFVRKKDLHKFTFTGKENCHNLNFIIGEEYMHKLLSPFGENYHEVIDDDKRVLSFQLNASQLNHVVKTTLALKSLYLSEENKVFQCKILVNYILNIFMRQYCPIKENYPDWLSNLLFVLNNPYSKIDNLVDLAKTTSYSYSRLSRLFKQFIGTTILEYVTQIKLTAAQELIRMSDMSIADIAMSLNFDSISHFNHIFKKQFNCTPSQYKKSLKEQ